MLKLKYFYEQRGFKTVAGIRQPDLWKAEKVIDCPSYRSHPYSKYLASVLHSDINAVKYCEEMLVNIAKLQRGELSKTSWSGNAFFTDIYPDRVEIEHQHFLDDPQWPLWSCPLSEFKVALEGWKRFLEMPVSLESEVIVELPSSDHS